LNVEWLARLPQPVRRGLYFGLQRAMGSRIGPIWREFLTWEKLTPTQHAAAVEEKLGQILDHAVQSSEFYRDLGLRRTPGESAREFLGRFPVLSRGALREDFPRIVADELRHEIQSPKSVSRARYGWRVITTGGTTGVPTAVVHDPATRDWGRATRLYAARLSGFPLGEPYFRLWGSEPDLLNIEAAFHLRVQRHLLGEILLNAFKAKEGELRSHHAVLRAHPEVRHVMAYVDAAASLAMFIADHNLPPPKLDSVQACAGTVTAEFREVIERTFAARVFNKYGSRECTDMACECERHAGLHVFSPSCYLEIVDANLAPCPPAVSGRILVTMLNNRTFPMIRYDIGDVGVWSTSEPCACGSPFPRLQSVEGRQDEMLTTEDGTLQSSVFIRHFVGVSLNRQLIREWQLEQTDRLRFVFRYLPLRREGLDENLAALESVFRKVLGQSITVEMREVPELPPTKSGKVRWVFNSYRAKACAQGLDSASR
jgi:phenylacetate-CoA ligase